MAYCSRNTLQILKGQNFLKKYASIVNSFIEREPMRIGVTGAPGFLGSHLIKALRELADSEVTTLQRNSSGSFPVANELRSFVKNLDLIYHIAGVNR